MIDLNDLRHSINRALNLGRYTLRVAVVGGEQVPSSIDLDLLERDDDLWGAIEDMNRQSIESVMARIHEALDAEDDHGPTIPAQPESVVRGQFPDSGESTYEFAAQDTKGAWALCTVLLADAPDPEAAAAADWVHVFDRVTRERRTLKRPEPDAVLKGLRDVAADLRKPKVTVGYDDPDVSSSKRGDPVEPPFGCYTPPVGPLDSNQGLKVGDVIKVIRPDDSSILKAGAVLRVTAIPTEVPVSNNGGRLEASCGGGMWYPDRFAFVARPGVWMPWSGGENPVPGMVVKVQTASKGEFDSASEGIEWNIGVDSGYSVTSYMVIDTPAPSSDT